MADLLESEVGGLKLINPTILAAGILGMTCATLQRVAKAGAGAVITKSLGLNPRKGYQNPTVVQVEGGVINSMGLPNPGIPYFIQELNLADEFSVPVIASIYAFSPEEFASSAKQFQQTAVDGLELNLSCPHTEKTGAEIGQQPESVWKAVKSAKKHFDRPVFVKLTPNVTHITELAIAAEKAGADGVSAINTVKAMAIDVQTGKPILGNVFGGLSGPAVKSIAIRCVYEIFDKVKIPILGCGGITTWQDAVEFIEAGASAVQIGTAVSSKGLGVFSDVANGIMTFMKKRGFRSVKEIVGLSHTN